MYFNCNAVCDISLFFIFPFSLGQYSLTCRRDLGDKSMWYTTGNLAGKVYTGQVTKENIFIEKKTHVSYIIICNDGESHEIFWLKYIYYINTFFARQKYQNHF